MGCILLYDRMVWVLRRGLIGKRGVGHVWREGRRERRHGEDAHSTQLHIVSTSREMLTQ